MAKTIEREGEWERDKQKKNLFAFIKYSNKVLPQRIYFQRSSDNGIFQAITRTYPFREMRAEKYAQK